MSLTTVMQIGRSALTASQLGLSVTGNNLANMATPGYSRQLMTLEPIAGDRSGLSVGLGVGVRDIRRQVDMALQARLWGGVAEQSAAEQLQSVMAGVESTVGALSGFDLSSELSAFFNAWSEKSNQTPSAALVVQQGDKLASFIKSLRADLTAHRTQIDQQLGAAARSADDLFSQIADLNTQISGAEIGGATASALRDQRDKVITELSKLMDVTTVEQPGGSIDVLVGSTPVVLGGSSRGVELTRQSRDGALEVFVSVRHDGQRLDVPSGQIGALLAGRTGAVDDTIDRLDEVASFLIFEINKLHSTGSNLKNPTQSTGTLGFPAADRLRAFNDPSNASIAALPFRPVNGGFLVQVKQTATGSVQTVRVNIDLDGLTAGGTAGTGDDTTPEQVRAALGAVPGLSASFTPEGTLQVTADQGYEVSFADDTSGVLAVLGMNAYFGGTDASDIAVRDGLKADPSQLLTGRVVDGAFVQNATALGVVGLQDKGIAGLSGRTIRGAWSDAVQTQGLAAQAAGTRADATRLVRESLEAQRAAVSGVSVDEESINLINYQQQYQAAARLISVADQLTQTLLQLV